jgi:adenylate cyclase
LGFGSGCLWLLGYPERSADFLAQAQALAGRLGHLPTFAASFPQWAPLQAYAGRDLDAVRQDGERIAAIGTELGIGWNVEVGTVLRGWVRAQRGDADGVGEMQRGFEAMIGGAVTFTLPYCRLLIAEAHRRRGAVEAGLHVIKHDPRIDADIFSGFLRAEFLRLEGEFRLLAGERAAAERCFLEALDIARRRQTKSLELRAATSLARLWRDDGKDDAARALLAPVYGWFSEGFATHDLIEAKALIDQLG